MNADNWTVCPICEAERKKEVEAERARVTASYGAASVEDFDQMRADLAERESAEPEETWREDWEIGLYGDELLIDYRGGCTQCRAGRKFRHTEIVTAKATP